MPINVHFIRNNPTSVTTGNFNGGAFIPAVNGTHSIYTAAACRVSLHQTPQIGVGLNGLTTLDPQVDPGGDTYFLPFDVNRICSMRLPTTAVAALAGVDSFLTTNLSGCKFFVDRVTNVAGEVIVYHANNMANAPPPQNPPQPRLELPACTTFLDQLYTNARADWTGAPHNLNLAMAGRVSKPTYNSGFVQEIQRKTGQGRNVTDYAGGTIVFGVANGPQWEFYWATYGSCEYDRPNTSPKSWFGHQHFNPTGSTTPKWKIIGSGII